MQISVLVEPLADSGFRAVSGSPLDLETAAATREEAIEKLRELIQSRLTAGAEVVALDLPINDHPLAKHVGIWKDNPLLEPWKEAMAEYRRQRDAADLIEDAQ